MIKKYLFALLIFTSVFSLAQDVERTLPAKWDSLVDGGRFADLFLPMPVIGELTSDTWGANDVLSRDLKNGIEDPAWSYWGGKPFQAEDGKYNMFVCRWREDHPKGHWAYHYSEIVRTISNNPVGPYKATDQIVGLGHNPDLYQLNDGRYVIYSVGEGHRIFYFISDSLDGPWKEGGLYDFDLRDRKKLRFMVNMSFVKREDGSYLAMPRAGDMWISKDGISTYERVSNGSTHPPMPGKYEDPVIWKDHIQYHKIVNDWYGRIAHYQRSKDGIYWVQEPGQAYFPGISKYEDGTQTNWYKYERIRMLQDEYGRAIQSNFAVIDTSKHSDFTSDNHNSKNISIPLTKSRLVEVLNTERITAATSSIILKIMAEDGFNPHKDMDLKSLRLGASETVNYGAGCRVKDSKKEGKDIVLTFEGAHGLTPENFALKLLGKTKGGKLLMAWARLPELDYLPPILSSRKPYIPENNSHVVELEVQNFGLSTSKSASIIIQLENEGNTIKLKGKISALKPHDKTHIQIENTAGLTSDSKGILSVYVEGCIQKSLFECEEQLNLSELKADIFVEKGKPLHEEALIKKGEVNSRIAKGKHAVGYHVYLPKSFNPKQAPPIVIAFSPGGRGKQIGEKIYDAAEEFGWVVVGCDSLRNYMNDEQLEMEIEDVLLNDILKTIPHNSQRIYLAGFSGGAMRAYGITARRSENFAGVIAYGGWLGGNDYQDEPYQEDMSVAIINGVNDKGANNWKEIDAKTFKKQGCTTKLFTHQGRHKIAPAETTKEVILWLNSEYEKRK